VGAGGIQRLSIPVTNTIESRIEIRRDHAANVERCQDGQMLLRWIAAAMGEAAKRFRRVNGCLHPPALRVALDRMGAGASLVSWRGLPPLGR
jgi:hypothetical protein